jgi:anti-anti-sigma factor
MTTTDARRVVDRGPAPPAELGIVVSDPGGGALVVAVAGEIDAATAPGLAGAFRAVAARRPSTITVDLTGVPFMDSSGVNALVELCGRTADWRGTVVVTGAAPNVRRVCELTGVEETDGLVLR